MDLGNVYAELYALENDGALYAETELAARSKALDALAFIGEVARRRGRHTDLTALQERAESLQQRLEAIDRRVLESVRRLLCSGDYTPQTLRRRLEAFTDYTAAQQGEAHIGYDGLDVLVGSVLVTQQSPPATIARDPEMVHHQATPARVILDLVDRVEFAPEDVFYDIGSGLGQVAILVNLLSNVRVKGIEFEPAYCDHARQQAQAFALDNVEFINVDARGADYSDGTIFFMFTPFRGSILRTVLDRLRDAARGRTVRLCTYGSCTLQVAREGWLESMDANADHEFKLALFRTC